MVIFLENIELLTDVLATGAPILLGLLAAGYLIFLLSWQQSPRASKPTTSSTRR